MSSMNQDMKKTPFKPQAMKSSVVMKQPLKQNSFGKTSSILKKKQSINKVYESSSKNITKPSSGGFKTMTYGNKQNPKALDDDLFEHRM